MMKRFASLFLLAVAASPSFAQDAGDYRVRQQNLTKLSGIFGELHHIRRMCEPRREADSWRNRMKKLVELEEPSATHHVKMVDAFNNSYKTAQRRYDYCDRDAEDYAAARAAQGDAIVGQLMAPLYQSMGHCPRCGAGMTISKLCGAHWSYANTSVK